MSAEPGSPQIHNNGPWGNAYTTEQIKHLREVFDGRIALLNQRIDALIDVSAVRKETVDKHLADLNNSHETARKAAKDADEKAERIANLAMTTKEFGLYKTAQEERGAVAKRAQLSALVAIVGVAVSLLLNLVRWWSERP